jgi:hypothetical protein
MVDEGARQVLRFRHEAGQLGATIDDRQLAALADLCSHQELGPGCLYDAFRRLVIHFSVA